MNCMSSTKKVLALNQDMINFTMMEQSQDGQTFRTWKIKQLEIRQGVLWMATSHVSFGCLWIRGFS